MLADLERVAKGQAPQNQAVWSKSYNGTLSNWAKTGSRNHPAMANALRVTVDPGAAADWWLAMLELELSGKVDAEGRKGFWTTHELCSGVYWGWSWLGAVTAFHLLTQRRKRADAQDALKRSLVRHAAMASLLGCRLVERGGRGQETYKGIGIYGAGARTNPAHHIRKDTSRVLANALGERPWIHPNWLKDDAETVARTVAALPVEAFGLDDDTRKTCLGFIERSEGLSKILGWVREVRAIVEYEIWLWPDRGCSLMRSNPNGNTSATFLSSAPRGTTIADAARPADFVNLHPYPGGRIRGKVSAGETELDGRTFRCWEFPRSEQGERGRPPVEACWQLPSATPLARIRFRPDQAPALVSTPPTPTAGSQG